MIARMLHIANSYPSEVDKVRFYAMKSRILLRFAKHDGIDVQHIPGKQCFGCGGSGTWYHTYSGDPDECDNCCGTGWYKSPKWVILDRYKLGRFVFHSPRERLYRKPDIECERPQISGYIEHRNYSWRAIGWSHFILYLLFDWRLIRKMVVSKWKRNGLYIVMTRKCVSCGSRTWSRRKWKCRTCQRISDAGVELKCDEVPF